MKIISAFRHHLVLLCVGLLATACDLQQTFDERIDDKQLLVLTPDFADTSVQLVFRDPETLSVIDEDFEVTVYSNKRLVDLNGNYKNEFIARGGVMEFSVSPEESVSESDPLELLINATSLTRTLEIFYESFTFNSKGFNTANLTPKPVIDFDETENQGSRIPGGNEPFIYRSIESFQGPKLTINGIIVNNNLEPKYIAGITFYIRRFVDRGSQLAATFLSRYPETMEEIEVGFSDFIRDNVYVELSYITSSRDHIKISYNKATNHYYRKVTKLYNTNRDIDIKNLPLKEDNLAITSLIIPKGSRFIEFNCSSSYNSDSNRVGFMFNVEGLEPEDQTILNYSLSSPSIDEIVLSSLQVKGVNVVPGTKVTSSGFKKFYPLFSTHLFPQIYLSFLNNNEFEIEPKNFILSNTPTTFNNQVNIKLTKRVDTKKHQLNISMRNENQNVGLALTFSALLRKQGQDDTAWETVNFKQGSTSVYLEEGNTYEVKLTLADEPFEFTFTNDLSLVEAAVQATLRNVTRIKDINYKINQAADLNTIDAEIVFYEGQSLID